MIFVYTPYPANPLFELSKKYGYNAPKGLKEWIKIDLNVKTTPWITPKYAFLTEMLRGYIFPMMVDYDKVMKSKRFKPLFKGMYLVAHFITKIRWEINFFDLPLEYLIFKRYIKPKLIEKAKIEFNQ